MIKTFIFKSIIWNSLLIIYLCDNDDHARFIFCFFSESSRITGTLCLLFIDLWALAAD
jgi:hypothetical protein